MCIRDSKYIEHLTRLHPKSFLPLPPSLPNYKESIQPLPGNMKAIFTFTVFTFVVFLSQARAETPSHRHESPFSSLDSTYTLKYFTNQKAHVFIDGKRVWPRRGMNGLKELQIKTCGDVLFFLEKRSQKIPTALSAFLVYNGISPVKQGNSAFYATRQAVKGTLQDYARPGQFKDAFVFQYDPAFDQIKMSPLFAITSNLTSYLDSTTSMNRIINVGDLKTELMNLRKGNFDTLPASFLDIRTWITASVVDAVLLDRFKFFKTLLTHGALPLNWRDGFMTRGYYALKICNPLCYPSDDVTTVLNGCYSRPVF